MPVKVGVVIPAHNEEASIAQVIAAVPRHLVHAVSVGANRCTDRTEEVARAAGAIVAREPRKGYGWACRAAIDALPTTIDTLVFLDGDFADDPAEIEVLLNELRSGADVVIGSRVLGRRQRGALSLQSRIGNRIAVCLIHWLYGHRFTDLGPFRALSRTTFEALELSELTFGWTVELQIKALQMGLRIVEVPVSYRRRVGASKVSGTITGAVGAGWGILSTIVRLGWPGRRRAT